MGDGQQEQSSVLHCSSPKNHFDKECIHKMSNEHRSCICQFTNIFLQYQPWHKSSTVDLNAVSLRKTSKALQATAGRGRGHWLGLSVSGAATEQREGPARTEARQRRLAWKWADAAWWEHMCGGVALCGRCGRVMVCFGRRCAWPCVAAVYVQIVDCLLACNSMLRDLSSLNMELETYETKLKYGMVCGR